MVKLEKSTVHVYLAPFLGVHAQIQWSKFHDTRLIGCTRLLGTPEYAFVIHHVFATREYQQSFKPTRDQKGNKP